MNAVQEWHWPQTVFHQNKSRAFLLSYVWGWLLHIRMHVWAWGRETSVMHVSWWLKIIIKMKKMRTDSVTIAQASKHHQGHFFSFFFFLNALLHFHICVVWTVCRRITAAPPQFDRPFNTVPRKRNSSAGPSCVGCYAIGTEQQTGGWHVFRQLDCLQGYISKCSLTVQWCNAWEQSKITDPFTSTRLGWGVVMVAESRMITCFLYKSSTLWTYVP